MGIGKRLKWLRMSSGRIWIARLLKSHHNMIHEFTWSQAKIKFFNCQELMHEYVHKFIWSCAWVHSWLHDDSSMNSWKFFDFIIFHVPMHSNQIELYLYSTFHVNHDEFMNYISFVNFNSCTTSLEFIFELWIHTLIHILCINSCIHLMPISLYINSYKNSCAGISFS